LSVARKWTLLALAGFVVSRIVLYYVLGVRFDAEPLGFYLQYADPALLRDDLIRTVWFLHSQPPLFNLFLGICLKLAPHAYTELFHCIFLLLGAMQTLLVMATMLKLRVQPWLAFICTMLLLVAPATMIYENWLFYTLPVSVLLSATVFLLVHYLETRRTLWAVGLFSVLALTVLTRGTYTLLWFLATAAVLILESRAHARQIARALAVPLVVLLAFQIKCYALFRTFTAGDTFANFNLAAMVSSGLAEPERSRLIANGTLPATWTLSLSPPHRPISEYARFVPHWSPTKIPVLDQETKASGWNNFNHLQYLYISRSLARGILPLFKLHPNWYLQGLANNFVGYVTPATDVWPFSVGHDNYARVASYERIYRIVVCGKLPSSAHAWFLIFGIPAILLFGIFRTAKAWRAKDGRLFAACAYMIVTIFSAAAGLLISWGDHNRYRFEVDPFYVILGAVLVSWLINRWVEGRSNHAAASESRA
jgi:hypothetical protein